MVSNKTFSKLIEWMDIADREREMSFAIALYESRVHLRERLTEALNCRTKLQKQKLYKQWKDSLPEEEVRELVGIMKNKHALEAIMSMKLIDPRH